MTTTGGRRGRPAGEVVTESRGEHGAVRGQQAEAGVHVMRARPGSREGRERRAAAPPRCRCRRAGPRAARSVSGAGKRGPSQVERRQHVAGSDDAPWCACARRLRWSRRARDLAVASPGSRAPRRRAAAPAGRPQPGDESRGERSRTRRPAVPAVLVHHRAPPEMPGRARLGHRRARLRSHPRESRSSAARR